MSEPHAHGVDDCPVHDVKPGLTPAQQRAWVPALIPPDPERDKRVAARRAADAARAGAALDRLLSARAGAAEAYGVGWRDGYRACAEALLESELHHNRHYARLCATCGAETERGGACPDCAAARRERQP